MRRTAMIQVDAIGRWKEVVRACARTEAGSIRTAVTRRRFLEVELEGGRRNGPKEGYVVPAKD